MSSNSSLLQAVRCMSSSKVFVGGLSYATDDTTLKDAFSHYGDVLEAKVIIDRDSGRSKGFGFITYTSSEEAAAAITAMDGKDLQGRVVRVNYANDRAGGIRGGGGFSTGGYGSGGYGSGGGYGSAQYGNGGGGYAGNGGYSGGVGGGEYFSMNNNAAAGGYSSGGSYNTAGNSDGSAGGYDVPGGYSAPNTYGAGNGAFGGSGGGFSSGHFGVAGGSNGGNFAGNVTGDSCNGNRDARGFGRGEATGFGTSQVQYNGQDDLLGADFFADQEDGHASRRA